MENWQKKHISKKLAELLKYTLCSTQLLQFLSEKGIIHEEDKSAIDQAVGEARTELLYKILETRVNSYEILKQSLKHTTQEVPLAILNQCSSESSLKYYNSISYDRNRLLNGGFGNSRVFQGYLLDKTIAVKAVNFVGGNANIVTEEINILKQLGRHDNILEFYHAEVAANSAVIAFELCSKSLYDCVEKKVYPLEKLDILKQITTGLEHLHKHRIIHRCLRPKTILFRRLSDSTLRVKLSDFGLSMRLQGHAPSHFRRRAVLLRGFGTQGWVSPEEMKYVDETDGLRGTQHISFTADIFALGCIFYYTLTNGVHPFGSATRCEVNILDNKTVMHLSDLAEDFHDSIPLIRMMIARDPERRPNCSQILSHAFLQQSGRRSIEDKEMLATDVLAAQLTPSIPLLMKMNAESNSSDAVNTNHSLASALVSPYDMSYEIPKDKLKIDSDHVLGTGQFGFVVKATIMHDNEDVSVALKTTRRGIGKCDVQGLLSEIKILSYLGKHKNIVVLVGAYTAEMDDGILYMVTEHCGLGSLERYLRSKKISEDTQERFANADYEEIVIGDDDNVTFNELARWSHEIACGMEYLGTKHVVHADLATSNVLLTSEKIAKITDFGLSRRISNYQNYVKTKQEPLPWRWMAIESLKRCEFSVQSDVWSYGITLWEIFTMGDTPYPGLSWSLNFVNRLVNGLRLECPLYASNELYEIMARCWHVDPKQRPNFNSLVVLTRNFATL